MRLCAGLSTHSMLGDAIHCKHQNLMSFTNSQSYFKITFITLDFDPAFSFASYLYILHKTSFASVINMKVIVLSVDTIETNTYFEQPFDWLTKTWYDGSEVDTEVAG